MVMASGRHTPVIVLGSLVLLTGLLSGCDSRPAAPALRDAPVYRSATEGFRFRVPEGWTQTANSALPPGDIPKEIFLARYRVQSPEGGASLQVLGRNDLAADALTEHFQKPAFGVPSWKVVEPLHTITVGDVPAERLVLSGVLHGKTMMQHVTCFHRRGRLYAFVGLYWQTDPTVRQQVERAVESVLWD